MISKTAVEESNFKKDIFFTKSAREGWLAILDSIAKETTILLPSYIGITEREGSGIYDPVLKTGLKHDFYNLNNDLSISTDEIKRVLKKKEYGLILLVHYFGFKITNLSEIVLLCKKNNLIVVEDCAHLYNFNSNYRSSAGSYGDFAFYSLHKNFPLKEGGLLVRNNNNSPRPLFDKNKTENQLALKLLQYDIKAIAKKRLKNYQLYDKLIGDIPLVRPLKKIAANDIPHNYPIIVENNLREKLYFWLINKDVTLIALYYRLIDSIEEEKYPEMHHLAQSILNLPVHQDINFAVIKKIIKLIHEGILELTQ